jgi:hypothetical protein
VVSLRSSTTSLVEALDSSTINSDNASSSNTSSNSSNSNITSSNNNAADQVELARLFVSVTMASVQQGRRAANGTRHCLRIPWARMHAATRAVSTCSKLYRKMAIKHTKTYHPNATTLGNGRWARIEHVSMVRILSPPLLYTSAPSIAFLASPFPSLALITATSSPITTNSSHLLLAWAKRLFLAVDQRVRVVVVIVVVVVVG